MYARDNNIPKFAPERPRLLRPNVPTCSVRYEARTAQPSLQKTTGHPHIDDRTLEQDSRPVLKGVPHPLEKSVHHTMFGGVVGREKTGRPAAHAGDRQNLQERHDIDGKLHAVRHPGSVESQGGLGGQVELARRGGLWHSRRSLDRARGRREGGQQQGGRWERGRRRGGGLAGGGLAGGERKGVGLAGGGRDRGGRAGATTRAQRSVST